jgi:hypothetical protein
MSSLTDYLLKAKDWALSLTFAVIAFGIMYVILVSYVSENPFEQKGSTILVKHISKDVMVLIEVRNLKSDKVESISASHELYEKDNPKNKLIVDGISFETQVGEYTVVSSTILPSVIKGTWCSNVIYTWWPTLSQRLFEMNVPDICFDTTEYD